MRQSNAIGAPPAQPSALERQGVARETLALFGRPRLDERDSSLRLEKPCAPLDAFLPAGGPAAQIGEGRRQRLPGRVARAEHAVGAQTRQRNEIDVAPARNLREREVAPACPLHAGTRERVAILGQRRADPAGDGNAEAPFNLEGRNQNQPSPLPKTENARNDPVPRQLQPGSAPGEALKACRLRRRAFELRPFS